MKLEGQVAIVTGGARGIGRRYALHLAGLGADVLVADVDFEAATAFGEELGAATVVEEVRGMGRRSALFGDLMKAETCGQMVQCCLDELGRLDIIVNNAGGNLTPIDATPSTVTEKDTRRQFDLNFMTTVNCCQAVAPIMKAQRSGVIVNTSSAAARFVSPLGRMASYGAAKAAVAHFTRSLARELGPFGIRVNSIAPGLILTSRVKRQRGETVSHDLDRVALGRFGTAEDCALVVEFLVTDLSRYVTGQSISVCGGTYLTPC